MHSKGSHRHIPALDGLRALAVMAVIGYHVFPQAIPGGYIGVDLFFVISGFLITTLLIAEHAKTGKIGLKNFWLRRARRLLPALFAVILVVGSVMFFVRGDVSVGLGRQILGAATFSSNWIEIFSGTDYFNSTTPHLFLNFWSLGVEEQFYLLWPFVALLVIAGLKRPKVGMALTFLLGAASAGWMAYLYAKGVSATRLYYGTDTHLFGLMAGAFLAFWARAHAPGHALRRLFRPFGSMQKYPKLTLTAMGVTMGGWLALMFTMKAGSGFAYLGGLLLATLLSAALIVIGAGSRGVVTRLFSLSPLEWIGKRSYGIYLWHWPLLVLIKLWLPHAPAWAYGLTLVPATFAIAALSYRFVEEPVRRNGLRATLKNALPRRKTRARITRRPHVALVPICLALVFTVGAVITAPAKTSAQLRIEQGERTLAKQQQKEKKDKKKAAKAAKKQHASAAPTLAKPGARPAVEGTAITAIGDSVMVASSPALQTRFPGILINAAVSRSMRMGGLETVQAMKQNGELRKTVIIALGTNGYYGTGLLDQMIGELQGHNVVLVTAHADREWAAPNNDEARKAAATYPNVAVADWDSAVAPHPEFLAEDGIHPVDARGDDLYTECIAQALRKF